MTFAAAKSCSDGNGVFLGIHAWYCGVDYDGVTSKEDLSGVVWGIIGNIILDLTIISAYASILFVIWGGYQYMFSAGDPGKAMRGQKTLTMALTGLVISLLAYVIVSVIGNTLGGSWTGYGVDDGTVTGSSYNVQNIVTAVKTVISIAGFVCAIFVVMGGITYITSAGEPARLEKAKKTIRNAIIGLVIVAFSITIVNVVEALIVSKVSDIAPPQENIITKEILS